jgi:four helix bundle protein
MPSQFRDLLAYRRSAELAQEVHSAVEHWPLLDRKTVGPQLIRAATSVGANIAEATGRWHQRDQRRFLFIARGSLFETEHWIVYCEQRGLLAHGTSNRVDEIARLLNGLITKRSQTSRLATPRPATR